MKRRQVTIKDIAKKLNISKSTVSRALNDADDISAETKTMVLQAVREMDYVPNVSAVNLYRGKSLTLGIIIPSFTIPFYARVISGIQNEALKSGYNVIVCQSNENYQQELKNVEILIQSGVDGIAISLSRETTRYQHLAKLKNKGIPVVLFNRVAENNEFSTVTVNDFLGASKATEYLIGSGRKKIAFIGGPDNILLAKNRRLGYEYTLKNNGLPVDNHLIFESDFSLEDGFRIANQIFNSINQPDAFFCVCDQVAYGVMQYLKAKKIKVPQEVSVAGFTNEAISGLTSPALTTVSQPMDEIGTKVAELLIDHTKHFTVNIEPVHIEYEPELIIREST